jgi:hypothetical protein
MSFFLSLRFFFSTKLEKRVEQVLPGSERWAGDGGEMAQTMYTHMNKHIKTKLKKVLLNLMYA